MATAVSVVPPTVEWLADQKKEYDALCRRINLDAENQRLSWGLLEKFYKTGLGSDGSRVWPACALFLIFSKSLPSLSAPSAYISLSQLLREANIKIVEFFDPLDTFVSATFSDDSAGRQVCEMQAKNLQLRFVTITIIYRKYQKMFDEFFIRDRSGTAGSSSRKRYPPGTAADGNRLFHFGWLLFLVARGKILNQGPPDFLKMVYLLLCCMDLMLIHASDGSRRVSVADLTAPAPGAPSMIRQDTLSRLCTTKDIHFASVKEFQERVFLTFVSTSIQMGVLNAEPDHGQVPASRERTRELLTPNTLYLPGLMDTCLDQNFRSLDREYNAQLLHSCDFDERLYLQNHPQVQTPHKEIAIGGTPGAPPMGSPFKALGSPFGTVSPVGPLSPVKATMNATAWLHKVVVGAGDAEQTRTALIGRLEATVLAPFGDPNPIEEIQKRATALAQKFSFGGGDTESRRRAETLSLYYRLLENIVGAEQKRLASATPGGAATTGLAVLVHSDKFHKSLLAAAVEIVMCCYNFPLAATPLEFPHVLRLFEVSAYDFGKVIESVVKHEPSMPRSVVKHLVHIEERVLEQLAWEEGSPLYETLNKPEERAELLKRLDESGGPQQPSSSACGIFSTPHKQKPPASSADGTASSSSSAATEAPNPPLNKQTTSLDLFFRKVAHLMSLRIKKLCEDLSLSLPYLIPDRLVKQIEYAMLYIVTQTDLMLNRHMDVMMMCTIYSLAKVSIPQLFQQQPVTFKLIIEKYHLQPQARMAVYKYVRVGENLDEDVIKFYNKIFLPQLEKFLLGFQPPPFASTPDSPAGTRSAVKRNTRFQEQQYQKQQQLHLQQQQQLQYAGTQKIARHSEVSLLPQITSPLPDKVRGRNTAFSGLGSPSASGSALKSPVKIGNVFLSPLRPTAPATPLMLGSGASNSGQNAGSKLIFQFGLSPHRQLHDINKSVNRDIAARKKLNFDMFSDMPSSPSRSLNSSSSSAAPAPAEPVAKPPASPTRGAGAGAGRGAKRKLDLDGAVADEPDAKRTKLAE